MADSLPNTRASQALPTAGAAPQGENHGGLHGIERVQELVNRTGTAAFIEALAGEIEADYRRWNEFDKSPRHAAHSAVGVIELMPITDGRLYSFKYVNGHPKNTAEGLLTVTAFGVLAEVATGYPILLSELTLTTALRTAAMSALAARRMARRDSRVMALIGNGAQSEFQAIALPSPHRHPRAAPLRRGPGRHRQARAQPRRAASSRACAWCAAPRRARPRAAPTSSPPSPPTSATPSSSRRR